MFRKKVCLIVIFVFGLYCVTQIYYWFHVFLKGDSLLVVYCDVGQGQAVLLQKKGIQVLVDAGPDSEGILSCLNEYLPVGDKDIEVLIATHSDADHIGGIPGVLQHYHVQNFYWNDTDKDTEVVDYIHQIMMTLTLNNVKISPLLRGDEFYMTDMIAIKTIWPSSIEEDRGSDGNENSVILYLNYKTFDMVLTGDAEAAAERVFPNNFIQDSYVDIYNVPHHGSDGSLSDQAMSLFSAGIYVVSVGLHNNYGHPAESTINLVEKSGANLLRTDLHGDIVITTDGNGFKIM